MFEGKTVAVIIPALNEAENLADVIGGIPSFVDRIVVADNGSTDGTGQIAIKTGAELTMTTEAGYGRACLAAIEHLENTGKSPQIIIFMAGDGSDDPDQMDWLVKPLAKGEALMSLASRKTGRVEQGAMTPLQKAGSQLAVWLIKRIWGVSYTDLAPYRAITWDCLLGLGMCDKDFGWTVEMQIKAAQNGVTFVEIPAKYRQRRHGRSKVGGSIKGSLMAGKRILGWIFSQFLQGIVSQKKLPAAKPPKNLPR